MKIFKFLFLFNLIFAAQTILAQPMGFGGGGGMRNFSVAVAAQQQADPRGERLTASQKGRLTGEVKNEAGEAVAGAIVAVINVADFPTIYFGKVGGSGKFSVSAKLGESIVEVNAPGYERAIAQAVVDKEGSASLKITLKAESDAPIKGKGNTVLSTTPDNYFLTVGNSSAYKGEDKTLMDVLADAPGVDLQNSVPTVMMNPKYEVRLNGNVLRVPIQALYQFFSSIKAEDVRSIKVYSGNVANQENAQLYITTNEQK